MLLPHDPFPFLRKLYFDFVPVQDKGGRESELLTNATFVGIVDQFCAKKLLEASQSHTGTQKFVVVSHYSTYRGLDPVPIQLEREN